jgi:hypothetical protein
MNLTVTTSLIAAFVLSVSSPVSSREWPPEDDDIPGSTASRSATLDADKATAGELDYEPMAAQAKRGDAAAPFAENLLPVGGQTEEVENRRSKALAQYEIATMQPNTWMEFTSTLSSVWAHSANTFSSRYLDDYPKPDFINCILTSMSAPPGYDFAFMLGDKIYADDGTYLGLISTNQFASESIVNSFGSYGSSFSATSIHNQFGSYGGAFSVQSPFNSFTTTPPGIFVGSSFVAYLTTNTIKTPRVDPNQLLTYLQGNAPGGNPVAVHRIEVSSSAPAGVYSFPIEYTFYSGGTTIIGSERVWFGITIPASNQPPTLSGIGSQSVSEGSTLSLTLSGSDPDGDALTYSASGSASGPTLSGNLFSWTPGYDQAGSYSITFTVSDGKGGEASEAVTITVSDANRSPTLSGIGGQSVAEGAALSLTLSGSDPDGDALTYSVSGNPPGSSLSGSIFSWTPGYDQAGSYQVTFAVSDGRGGEASEAVTITVSDGNRSPTLSGIGGQSVAEGAALSLTVSGSDPDGDALTYSASGNPSGSSLSGSTFSWTPGHDQAGSYSVTFTISDGKGGEASEVVTITVSDANRSPTLSGIGGQSVAEGAALSLTVSGSDPDGDALTYSISGNPSGSSLSSNVFSWTPGYDQAGNYSVMFTISDGKGGEASEAVTITVSDTNRSPTLSSIGSQSVAEGAALSLTVSGSDPDGDALTYSISGNPSGSSLSSNVFSWTPSSGQAGSYQVTFVVSDGKGGEASEGVTITVVEVNRPPTLSSIGSQSMAEGAALSLTLSGSDPDGDALTYSVSDSPSGSSLSGNIFSWTPDHDQAGSYSVTFTIGDGRGGEASETVSITVSDANRPPTLSSIGGQSVAEGAALSLTLSGSDPDGDALTYSVSGNPSGSSLSGSIFSWTPGYDQADSYQVTFAVSDGRGGEASEAVTITVSDGNRAPRYRVSALRMWQKGRL